MFKKVLATGAMLAMAGSAAQAQNIVVYNNTTTVTAGFRQGGATSATGFTDLAADDINVSPTFGGRSVASFKFTVYNGNTATTAPAGSASASPTVTFYAANGTDADGNIDGPGTYLGGTAFNPITLNNGQYTVLTFTNANEFVIPANGKFWAAISYSSTTATLAQLNSFGVALFNPPTVGSSADRFFISDAPTQGGTSRPAGFSDYSFTGGNPVGNFGFEFEVAPAPEPSQYAAFGLGILGVGALALKARRRGVTA